MKTILLVSDVSNWAWAAKSRNIQKFVSSKYKIDIWYYNEGLFPTEKKYDLYVTYTGIFLSTLRIERIPKSKIALGTTSHNNRIKGFGNRILNNRCLAIHANSMLLYNECLKNHKKVFYVPNGVDTKLFSQVPPPNNKDLVVSFVAGGNALYKGLSLIKIAASQVGGVKLKINTNIYQNAIPIEKMPEFYNDIDIHVVGSSDEGTPNPALEASARGRPVIATRVGNMPEFIKDGYNGFLVDRQPSAIAEKIIYFKKDKVKREEMGRNARKTAEQWDWRINVKYWEKMFQELLNV